MNNKILIIKENIERERRKIGQKGNIMHIKKIGKNIN